MNVLYIGSGKSAQLIENIDLSKYYIVCANNAWRLFENSHFDVWLHTGDFPTESRPLNRNYDLEISHNDYSKSAINIMKKLNLQTNSPMHNLGYTVFFNGLYWIFDQLQPQKVSLLGFDHDYNQEKLKKWDENGRPNPQNNYKKPRNQSLSDWSEKFFDGMETDSFYGHGTPDPMRLGAKHLKQKFMYAIINANKLNIDLVNLSPVESTINMVRKEPI